MTDISHAADVVRARPRRGERWEFHALVAATYPLFLASTVMGRAAHNGGEPQRSVFTEAYAVASASLACAFMG